MPTSFFAKTLRRSVRWLGLGVCPGVFVKWWPTFLGVSLVTFLGLLVALLCVFLFRFGYGYVGYGLLLVWLCVGNCFVFVKSFHYVRLAYVYCLVVVLSSAL